MNLDKWVLSALAALAAVAPPAAAAPTVYPTGVTIYDPARTWNGYTVLSPLATQAVLVIDMNGNVVKRWDDLNNSAGGPARVLPGGGVISARGSRPPHQESLELVQRDFDGKVVWSFSRNEQVELPDRSTIWSARQHHDWQREDFPAGYYSPDFVPAVTGANTLILTHTNHVVPAVADVMLEDDRLIEVSPDGRIVWEWVAGEHIDELGFAADARVAIKAARDTNAARGSYDWLHVNSATYLGPNRWFDAGDERFAPNNVIISGRQASLLAIVGRDGKVAWRLGPDFSASAELRKIGQIVGQHHAHLIPKGLPGAGHLLVFDNGGSSGYGFAGPIAPDGVGAFARATSRVLEINPVTLELVWSYASPRFFSTNISGAQRLPNGNTLITEGAGGRVFEVTSDGAIVWEYMNPLFAGPRQSNDVYRAYRLPYGWMPQLTRPRETAVTPPAPGDFAAASAFAETPSSVPACNLAAASGVTEQQLSSGGLTRSYRLFVPAGYDGHTRLPLVLDLHGSGGNAAAQASTSRFEALAAREGMLVAALQGENGRWNVPVAEGRPDDVRYVSDVIDHVAARVCLDATRVYSTGFSGGGRMTSLLGCRLSERIAAIAPMAGLRWPGSCDGRPVPVFTVHGLADPQNTYAGHVEGRGGEWLESVPDALAGWAAHNGCDANVVAEDPPGPLSIMRYEGCDAGAEVRLIRVDGLVHRWARDEVDATAAMWEFFQAHSL